MRKRVNAPVQRLIKLPPVPDDKDARQRRRYDTQTQLGVAARTRPPHFRKVTAAENGGRAEPQMELEFGEQYRRDIVIVNCRQSARCP